MGHRHLDPGFDVCLTHFFSPDLAEPRRRTTRMILPIRVSGSGGPDRFIPSALLELNANKVL